jgi:uncharacterized BrkB/YihY/UPF0761 family membrane protein
VSDDRGEPLSEPVAPVVTEAGSSSKSASVRDRVSTARDRVTAARATVPAVDAAFEIGDRDRAVGGSLLAGALAYRLFLWLLPVTFVLAAGLGFLGAADRDAPEDVAEDLGLTGYVSSTVSDAAQEAEDGRWVLLGIGLVALATTSSTGAKTVRAVHARAWGLPPRTVRASPVSALAFIGISLLTILVTLFGSWAQDRSAGVGVGVRLSVVFVYGLTWLLVSTALPRRPGVRWTALVPGALLFAAGAQALHLFTVFYLVKKLQTSSELYGALGGAAAVLLWLFLVGRLVVGSAVLNATLEERRRKRRVAL